MRQTTAVYDVAMNGMEGLSRDQLAKRLKLWNRLRLGALILPFAGIASCLTAMAFAVVQWPTVVVVMVSCVMIFGVLNNVVDKSITAILDEEERTAHLVATKVRQ